MRALVALVFAVLSAYLSAGAAEDSVPRILTPRPDAVVPSAYVSLSAIGPQNSCWQLELDAVKIATACGATDGRLEKVVYVGSGRHRIALRALQNPDLSVGMNVTADDPRITAGVSLDWGLLEVADVVLVHTNLPEQAELFDPQFTHAGLYLGPDESGAPLVLEAVREELAEGLGEIRALPLEHSGLYRTPGQARIFRLARGVPPEQRDAIVRFGKSLLNRGLHYRDAASFADLYSAWLLWDPRADRPRNSDRFDEVVTRLREQKESLTTFDCATLIWRAYWEGTDRQVDLSEPNRMEIRGQLAGKLSEAFLRRIRPYFLSVDTLYESSKLVEVSGR